MRVAVIDFHDSFTFNLVHYLENEGAEVNVFTDGGVDLSKLYLFDRIVLSPGPGLPKETKQLVEVIDHFYRLKPMLGVCLGMQGIAEYFGGTLVNLPVCYHGFSSVVNVLNPSPIFKGLPVSFNVARYHSWAVKEENNASFVIDARTEDGILMSIRHREFPVFGLQFHPESILTDFGKEIIHNFIDLT